MLFRSIGYGPSVSFNDYIKKMSDIYGDEWNQPSPGEYGFRIVIEPFLSFWMKNADGSSNYWYYTPKEAALKGTTFDSKKVGPFSTYLSLNWTDVQIQARAGAATSMADLANPKLGYGYNIIDINNLGKPCTPGDKDCPNQCKEDDPSCNVCKEDDPDCGGSGCLPTDPDCGEPDCDIKDPKCNNPKTCDYKIDMSIPNNCETSNLGYIYEINYWKCIFASSNSKKTDIKNHYDDNFSNKYCAIYCYEKIDYRSSE